MQPKILVFLPGRQHAHQLVYALQEHGYLAKMITSLWYKPDKFPYRLINFLPSKLKESLENELKKRYYEKIEGSFIEQFPFFEMLREAFDRLLKGYKHELGVYMENQIHDWYVARRLSKFKPDMVVGYETSSLRTFERARSLNAITVLDLSQVHYGFIDEIRREYVEFDNTFDNRVDDKVNKLKERELRCADYIITLSNFVRETLINHGVPESKIYLANLGFDPEKFTPKENYGKNRTFKILYVGVVTKRKGTHLLLEAYRQLNLKNSELTLIGGSANDRDFLKEYKGTYKHIPYLDHERLVSYYQDADIFVFPSYLDSWGMVVIEAMACGTPVIVSENTGAKEVVENGINGFITPVDDINTLKEKVLFLYNKRDKLEYLGRNARKRAEDYTWGNYAKRIREIIEEIWSTKVSRVRCSCD